MAARWELFPIAASAGVPPLLIKVSLQNGGYTIQFTDLTYIWSESLDRQQIIEKAVNEETSVDPSEGESQLKILLGKIQSALKGDEETSIKLKQSNDGQAIDVHLTASLPLDLGPLEWCLHLVRLLPSTVRSEIVLPKLGQLHLKNQQLRQFVTTLHDKDHVIDKLLDKLEASGLDLTTVFPGAAGIRPARKGSQREQAAHYVRGLGKFDLEKWKESSGPTDTKRLTLEGLLSEVFAEASPDDLREPTRKDVSEAWWGELDNASASPEGLRFRRPKLVRDKTVGTEPSTGEDEFERQPTPPQIDSPAKAERSRAHQHLASSRSNISPGTPQDQPDDTEDDGDLDVQASQSHRKDGSQSGLKAKSGERGTLFTEGHPSSSKSTPKKLGTIGGRKAKASDLPVNEDDMDLDPTRPSSNGSEQGVNLHQSRHLRQADVPQTTRKPKLGTIGGKHADTSHKNNRHSASPATPPRRLGVIAGNHRSDSDSRQPVPIEGDRLNGKAVAAETPEEATTTVPPSSARDTPRESSQERADRKRLELKHQLEERSKVTAKKKRKF